MPRFLNAQVIRKAPCVGRKVGSLAFEPLPAHGYICNLFVLEEWRRQGVARTLLIQAEQQVQRWGLNHMALTVEQHNTAAQLCYQSLDYVLRGSAQEGMLWKDLVPRNTPP
ncbi:hypothetical protein JKP88DRAFT_305239 [Tribonema minus]|uniref:N-acetyltransferase domain-containing protein n=1 Tax=Tribonema minus TaxID=303371 RepID=A0A835ZB62_9STRA|nr:hypothetical protein JKP88DRAFT_305239 [Tribonema minus]